MKNATILFSSFILLTVNLFVSSCSSLNGTGPLVTEARNPGEVTAVDLEMDANVYLIKGDSQSVVIRAQQNILDVLKTDFSGGKLKIKTSESISVTDPIEIWITTKTIESLELDGSGSIVSTTEFNSEKVSADLSGSGKISLVLNSEKFEADLSGSGDIYLKGKVAKGKFDISGSGNIYALECDIDDCKANIEGTCHIQFCCS